MSFFSKDLYRDVAINWHTGRCFAYLLALIALCWIPAIVKVNVEIAEFVDNEAPRYVRQMPAITIEKGSASISEPQPFVVKKPDTDEPFLIINTSGTDKSDAEKKVPVLITKSHVYVRDDSRTYPVFDFAQFEDAVIDQKMVYEFLEGVKESAAYIIYPIAVLIAYAYRSVQVLLMSLIGIGMARLMGVRLDFRILLRIVIAAMTPLLIINALLWFFSVPDYWIVNIFLLFGYMFFAIRSATAPASTR